MGTNSIKSIINSMQWRLLEKRCDEKGKIAINLITKINKRVISTSLKIILSDGNSFVTIQTYIPITRKEEFVWRSTQ